MKNKLLITLISTTILLTSVFIPNTFAQSKTVEYNFHITKNGISGTDNAQVLLPYTIDEKTLINGKIAPGTSGFFNINIKVDKNTLTTYEISFADFSIKLPRNLKFYYLDKEINLKDFYFKETKISEDKTYKIDWIWNYETPNGDFIDTEDSITHKTDTDSENINTIGYNFNFNIELVAEYEEKDKKPDKNEKPNILPKTGDMSIF